MVSLEAREGDTGAEGRVTWVAYPPQTRSRASILRGMEQRQNDHVVVNDVDPVLQHLGCARNPALAQIGLGNVGRRAWVAGDHVGDESGDTPAQACGGFGRTLLDEIAE